MKDRVLLELCKPAIKYTDADRQGLPDWAKESSDATRAFLAVRTIMTMVQSKHQQGIDGKDGKRWAKFLDFFLEEPLPLLIEVAREDFGWLRKIVADDDVKIPFVGMSQWRMAVERYFDEAWSQKPETLLEEPATA